MISGKEHWRIHNIGEMITVFPELLKSGLYSLFNIFLRDIPEKELFEQSRRFYNHECLRMEKPFELRHLISENNKIAMDMFIDKGCLTDQESLVIPVKYKISVMVWYNPVGISMDEYIIYYEDVYQKFN